MKLPDEQQWRVLNELLDDLLALDPAARKHRLESLAREQPELMKPLRRLLASAGRTDTLDAVLGHALNFLADQEGMPEQRRLGPWQLNSELGRGGMAQVFFAERADGAFEQKVALKLIWPGMAGPNVLARFEQERQILASLDDTRIARLIDGGVAEDGRPWLAMEYVEGVPVDRYCDEHRLDIEARLKLFCEIAAAISAAHRRLVVHRDIKPANVLVTAEGQVKLLDFGIAKLLDAEAMPHAAPETRHAERLLTPEYASPEQLTESPITTASDVYQLGALLFQLLSGEPPHRRKGLSTAEFENRVLTEDPPHPSARVRGLGNGGAESAARARRLTRKALIRRLRGDLDAIVMTAMDRAPERRYRSVEQMIADVERHLHGQPVQARRPTIGYRAGRFLRRHMWITAAVTAFVLLVFAYAGTVTYQAGQLATERDQVRLQAARAERVRDFLVGIFDAADPFGPGHGKINTQDLLEMSVERIRGELADEPEVRAELLGVLGHIYLQYSQPAQAEPLLAEALQIRNSLHQQDHPDLARAIYLYAAYLTHMGDYTRAEREARRALAMRESLLGRDHVDYLMSLGQVTVIMMYAGRYLEAEPAAWETLSLRRQIGYSEDVALSLNVMGIILTGLGRYQEAEELYREGIAIRESLYQPHQAAMATIPHNLAVNLMRQGRFEEAESLLRDALALRRDAHPEGHPRIAYTLDNLGRVTRLLGRPDEAEKHHREALEIRRRFGLHDHRNRARGLHALGRLAQDRGEVEQAESLYLEALEQFKAHNLECHPSAANTRIALGWMWLRQGRVSEAEPLFEEALDIHLASSGEYSDSTAQVRVALGLLRTAQGQTDQARALLEPGLERLKGYALADPEMLAALQDGGW